jgi:predicted CXXCH cytochrome family protein
VPRVRARAQVTGLVVALTAGLGAVFVAGDHSCFLPGTTSDGHHVFERACSSCHTPFRAVANDRCVACHRAELADDTHPASLFDDPRWAADLERIDAAHCVTCHREHRVAPAGVTASRQVCFPCHDVEARRRPDHRGFSPASCGDAGCHNYHDNAFLNRAYLARHGREPAVLPVSRLAERREPPPAQGAGAPSLAAAPLGLASPPALVAAWRASAHARQAVGCTRCHLDSGRLVRRPGESVCASCHGDQVGTFHTGTHGVRARLALPPLGAADARLPMRREARERRRVLGCATCHDPHGVDTRRAAVEACLDCHDDRHSRSFAVSPHAALRRAGARPAAAASPDRAAPGGAPGASTVTCATCHMPRVESIRQGRPWTSVDHDNTATLRPPDRMVGRVCSRCHGVEFALASMLDRRLVDNNFKGRPAGRLESFVMLEALAGARPQGAVR